MGYSKAHQGVGHMSNEELSPHITHKVEDLQWKKYGNILKNEHMR